MIVSKPFYMVRCDKCGYPSDDDPITAEGHWWDSLDGTAESALAAEWGLFDDNDYCPTCMTKRIMAAE